LPPLFPPRILRKFLHKLPEHRQAQYFCASSQKIYIMIRKLKKGQYRIYSRKIDPKTKRRRNLGTFDSLEAARQHEKAIQYFKHA